MSYYDDYQRDMASDRQAIAELKGGIEWAKHRLQSLDRITPNADEVKKATGHRTPQESMALMRRWGLDPRDKQHREAWRNRNRTSF